MNEWEGLDHQQLPLNTGFPRHLKAGHSLETSHELKWHKVKQLLLIIWKDWGAFPDPKNHLPQAF